MRPISLRWKWILASWSLAFAIALLLTVLLHLRNERHLREQLEKTLETKCDEVITVLKRRVPFETVEQFFLVETAYRFSPQTYFYQITDESGRIVARSENLGEQVLPVPAAWEEGQPGVRVNFDSLQNPIAEGERIRIRSEIVELESGGELVIQTAGSLRPLEQAVHQTLRDASIVAGCALAAVFFLLWFVTTRSLRPVAAMTWKASEITATNLRERLPVDGSGDELDALARVLNGMLDRLASSLKQIERFSSDAAHQLRTPLTRIRGELDLLLKSARSEPLRSELERVEEEVDRLGRLCGRLLFLARFDQQSAENGVLAREGMTFDERIELGELASELVEQVSPLARERGVELRRGSTSPAFARGSRSLLVEALLNLLNNAIDVSPVGSAVVVSVDAMGNDARVSIEDHGPGIPVEERERVFERFYRIVRGSENEDGSGLGLAIVRGIVQAHRGSIEIEDAPGHRGTVFRLILPSSRS